MQNHIDKVKVNHQNHLEAISKIQLLKPQSTQRSAQRAQSATIQQLLLCELCAFFVPLVVKLFFEMASAINY